MVYVTMATIEEGMMPLLFKEVNEAGHFENNDIGFMGDTELEVRIRKLDENLIRVNAALDRRVQMANAMKCLKKPGGKQSKEVLHIINQQLDSLKDLSENARMTRLDLNNHMMTLRGHLARREQDLLRYIDDTFIEETGKIFSSMKKLTSCVRDVNDSEHQGLPLLLQGGTEDCCKLTFKPLYSIDVGMVLKSAENASSENADCFDYDFTCFSDMQQDVGMKFNEECPKVSDTIVQEQSPASRRKSLLTKETEQHSVPDALIRNDDKTRYQCDFIPPQLPLKSAKLTARHMSRRRRKSVVRRGLGFASIHRRSTETQNSSEGVKIPTLPERPILANARNADRLPKQTRISRQFGITENVPADSNKDSKKEEWFVEVSEENAYAKSEGMEQYLVRLKLDREKKVTEQPCQYEELQFQSKPSKHKKDGKVSVNLPEKTAINSHSSDEGETGKKTQESPISKTVQPDYPPLPPRLYRPEDVEQVSKGARNVDSQKEGGDPMRRTEPQVKGSYFDAEAPRSVINAIRQKKDSKSKAQKGKMVTSSGTSSLVPKRPNNRAQLQPPEMSETQGPQEPNVLPKPGVPDAADMQAMCRMLSPDILSNIFREGFQEMDSEDLTGATESIQKAMNWPKIHLSWEQSTSTKISSAVFLSDTRIVLLVGNWLRFLTKTGNLTSRCELKQIERGGPLHMTCAKSDILVISSTWQQQILVVPTNGSRVKGSLYTIPDVTPDFATAVDDGYVVGGLLKIKGDWRPGIAVLNGRLGYKTRWQVKHTITDMCTAANNIYICFEENHSIAVYNLSGKLLHSFGDSSSMFQPGALSVDLNGDVFVVHKTSKDDPDFKVSSWSSGGSKQAELLTWTKSKGYPSMACQRQKLVLAADNVVVCYQIDY